MIYYSDIELPHTLVYIVVDVTVPFGYEEVMPDWQVCRRARTVQIDGLGAWHKSYRMLNTNHESFLSFESVFHPETLIFKSRIHDKTEISFWKLFPTRKLSLSETKAATGGRKLFFHKT